MPRVRLTTEQEQNLATARAEWDDKFAPELEALRESSRITEHDLSIKVGPCDEPDVNSECQHEWAQETGDAGVAVYRCKHCHMLGAGPPKLAKKRSPLSGGGF